MGNLELLMEEIISSFEISFDTCDIPEEYVVRFWKFVIGDFGQEKFKALAKCLGQNELWDLAYALVEQENKSN